MTPFRLHARNSQAAPALISYCAGVVSSSPSTSWQPSNENDIKGHNPLEGLTMNVLEGTGTMEQVQGHLCSCKHAGPLDQAARSCCLVSQARCC